MFLKYKVIVLGVALALAYSPAVFAQSNPASGGDSANGTPGPTSGSNGGYIQSQTPSSTGQGTTDPSVTGHGPCNAVAGKAGASSSNSSASNSSATSAQTSGAGVSAGTAVTKDGMSGGDSANGC
jgi:hypothetical protein